MSERASFWARHALMVKGIIIGILALLLLIPKSMIEDLIYERQSRKDEAITEVSSKWAHPQTITGPLVTIPYYVYFKNKEDEITKTKRYAYILPEELKITGNIDPEVRKRGIFEIPVYKSEMELAGSFDFTKLKPLNIKREDMLFEEAQVHLGISDLRGIENNLEIAFNTNKHTFEAGTAAGLAINTGVHANVDLSELANKPISFKLPLKLRGSAYLYLSPVGKSTEVDLNSSWADPKFDGAFFPVSREITPDGFNASWKVFHLNRNFPQMWTSTKQNLNSADFGFELFVPAGNYQQSMRSVKYALLFIALTFLVFYFSEALNGRRVHPIQYILIGLSLILFYSLLVSISEHLSFNTAYLIAAGATVFTIFLYAKAVLKSWQLAAIIGSILTLLYGFILTVISIEEYALLTGSIGLFIILGTAMYFSRKIDWYQLNNTSE